MACATLKRSLEWEPVLGGARPAKRRRCIPFCESPPHNRDRAAPQSMMMASTSSSSSSSSAAASSPRAFASPVRHLQQSQQQQQQQQGTPSSQSVFPEVVGQKLTPEYMAENLRAELKRLQRRKQLQFSMENADGNNASGEHPEASRSDRALFTFKQVGLICERMLRELESEIRAEYDNVLTSKLAEQYDAFVKFTYDQIQKNYSAAPPSYLS